jgi:predicted ATPase
MYVNEFFTSSDIRRKKPTHFQNDNQKDEYFKFQEFLKLFKPTRIYKPDPNKFTGVYPLSEDQNVEGDCANLVPFLFNLGQNNKKQFKEIEKGLVDCVGDLVSIGTPAVQTPEGSKLRLKFFDKDENTFWADEVSEGVLYFLALLCIVHQPNPPKVLLLEEPERGIHPRRINEVMDFIFQLAQQKDIQVIMTTHHERVVDYFADIPESVFIFDKDSEGATQVKNLKHDVIEPLDKQYEKDGLPKIKFAESLGELSVIS